MENSILPKLMMVQVGSQPCRSVSQGVAQADCLPKTAWPPTCVENAEGTIFTTQYIPTASDKTKAFNEAVKKKYGVDGEFHIAKAYDGAKMLVQAMNNAYPKLDGATIAKELKKLNYEGITGDYHFNTTGEGSNRAQLGIIKNGNAELLK